MIIVSAITCEARVVIPVVISRKDRLWQEMDKLTDFNPVYTKAMVKNVSFLTKFRTTFCSEA